MKRIFTNTLWGTALLAVAAVAFADPAQAVQLEPLDPTEGWNELWHELLIDLLVIGTVYGLAAVWMLLAFRAKNPTDVGNAPKLSTANAIGWALIPAAIFLADDLFLAAKGWVLYNVQTTVPADAYQVDVVGRQWSWEFTYEGNLTTDELVVPVGQNVVLNMTSPILDENTEKSGVIHGFGMPTFRMTQDLMPGRTTTLWFVAKEAVETKVNCREFCGTGHSDMSAPVRAVSRAEFNDFIAGLRADARLKTNGGNLASEAAPVISGTNG